MDDAELLKQFATERSDESFRALALRHVNLVYSAALRQTADACLAEEVSQAVFILLARKAKSVDGARLPGWLFKTTRFIASRAVRAEMRRKKREQEAIAMQESQNTNDHWLEVAPDLDAAVLKLGHSEREAIVLRYFSGLSNAEISRMLGISEDAAKKRVSRGVEKLRNIFEGHGIKLTATVLAVLLQRRAIVAAPITVANLCLGAGGSSLSASSLSMAAAALVAMRWLRFWTMTGGLVTALVTGLVIVNFSSKSGAESQNNGAENSLQTQTVTPSANKATQEDQFVLHVVAAESGEPIANAAVAMDQNFNFKFGLTTDEHGDFSMPRPTGRARVDIGVATPGREARYVTFGVMEGDLVPAEYTLKLARVTNSLGGRLVDETGVGIAGAQIFFSFGGGSDSSGHETPRERTGFMDEEPLAITDREGYWSCKVIPNQHRGFSISVKHAPYEPTTFFSCEGTPAMPEEHDPALKRLLAGTEVTALRYGIDLTGYVEDEHGAPVARATIYKESQAPKLASDPNGAFHIEGLKRGAFEFTVVADGFAPARVPVTLENPQEEVTVKLKHGATLRLKLVDENGENVPGATVGLEEWGTRRHVLEWERQSDENGQIEWDSAPAGERLEFYARKEGFCYTRGIYLQADGVEHVVEMRRAFALKGSVVDATTRLPVSKFKAIPSYGAGTYRWERLETVNGANGEFQLLFKENQPPWEARIEADGYEVWDSGVLDTRTNNLRIELQPVRPENAISGVVLKPTGEPAIGATVELMLVDQDTELEGFRLGRPLDRWTRETDANGAFSLPPSPKAHSVLVVSRDGFARVRLSRANQPLSIRLHRWGRIEGMIDPRIPKTSFTRVYVNFGILDYPGHVSLSGPTSNVRVDGNGRFILDYVPPELIQVALIPGSDGGPFHHLNFVQVEPGETTNIVIQSRGVLLEGKFVSESSSITNFAKQVTHTQVYQKHGRTTRTTTEDKLLDVDFWFSEAGRLESLKGWGTSLDVRDDGSFRAWDYLPAGTYKLKAYGNGEHFDFETEIVIPEVEGVETLDLGEISSKQQRAAAK